MLGALMLLSLLVAGFWAFAGVWWVLLFSGIEVSALVVAFFCYARHASDCERIAFDGDRVSIESVNGTRTDRLEGRRGTLTLSYDARPGGLVEVRESAAGGRSLSLGRFVPEGQRAQLAKTLSQGLRLPLERSF